MNVFGLTTDKLIPVDLPQVCAPRGALLSRLDEACDGRYAYIGAPAGCGKTVTALLWLQKTGRKTIWLGLDGYDNTPTAFYSFFCTALFSAVSQDERLIALVRDRRSARRRWSTLSRSSRAWFLTSANTRWFSTTFI